MKRDKTPKNQLIVRALLQGKPVKFGDFKETLQKAGWKVSDLSNILWVMCNPNKCPMGHFIQKKRDGRGFIYSLADEALKLPEDKAFALTYKSGEYTLEQALDEYPDLKKYVPTINTQKIKTGTKEKPAKEQKPAIVEQSIVEAKPIKKEKPITEDKPIIQENPAIAVKPINKDKAVIPVKLPDIAKPTEKSAEVISEGTIAELLQKDIKKSPEKPAEVLSEGTIAGLLQKIVDNKSVNIQLKITFGDE